VNQTQQRTTQTVQGVTLLELLVAIAIVALVAATTTPALNRAVDGARFSAAARELATALGAARREATSRRSETTLVVDTETGDYIVGGDERSVSLPSGASITLVTATTEQLDGVTGAIRFFADGSSTGGTITLAHENRRASINVDWLTGNVSVVRK
jgi:general secretion pathway protein H